MPYGVDLPQEKSNPDNLIVLAKDIKLSQVDNGAKLIIGGNESTPNYNMTLIQAVVKSFYYHKELEEDRLSAKGRSSSYIKKIMNLRYLSLKIIEDIINGRQEKDLTLTKLMDIVVSAARVSPDKGFKILSTYRAVGLQASKVGY